MPYLKLLLIRHAESLGNTQKKMEGQSSTALSELGVQQAHQLAIALSASTDLPTHLYSSPLLRAQQTAAAISTALDHANHAFIYKETKALCEMHQGIFQGLTWPQAQAAYPTLCEQLMATSVWQPIPEAETLVAARSRAKSWFKFLLNAHGSGDVVWAISHEGFLQHLISVVMGCDRTWQIRIAHTAIFEFWLSVPAVGAEVEPSETLKNSRLNAECWLLRRFNSQEHLVDRPCR